MPQDSFLTLAAPSPEVIYKDKSSKFLGYAFPIASEDAVKPLIEMLKKKHHAARHWCYAWQLGVAKIQYRANDDGEPSNAAGKPIYGQIQAFKVTNVLIVVVRYYGGINLGVGGLIQAYKTAAKLSLESAEIVEKVLKDIYTLKFEYKSLNTVMRLIKELDAKILSQKMELDCHMKVAIRKSDTAKFLNYLTNLHQVKVNKFS
jgi:uncharacterized YigZ family protein